MHTFSRSVLVVASTVLIAVARAQYAGLTTVGLSPAFLTQAADVTSANFHTSVMDTFFVGGLNNAPLPSQQHCSITYDNLVLQSFSTSGFSVTALNAPSQNTGTVQFDVNMPAFVLQTVGFSVLCQYPTPMGVFSESASGTIQGSWSSPSPITVWMTQTQTGGTVALSDPVLQTTITMDVTYTYTTGGPPAFVYDIFINHHMKQVLMPAVNNALMAMFGIDGPPINLVRLFMNDVITPWNGACSTNQEVPNQEAALGTWLFINEQPACAVVNLTVLPTQQWTSVTQTPSFDSQEVQAQDGCHASHTQEHFIKVPGYTEYVKIIFSNCTHCTTGNGKYVGVSCQTAFEGTLPPQAPQKRKGGDEKYQSKKKTLLSAQIDGARDLSKKATLRLMKKP